MKMNNLTALFLVPATLATAQVEAYLLSEYGDFLSFNVAGANMEATGEINRQKGTIYAINLEPPLHGSLYAELELRCEVEQLAGELAEIAGHGHIVTLLVPGFFTAFSAESVTTITGIDAGVEQNIGPAALLAMVTGARPEPLAVNV